MKQNINKLINIFLLASSLFLFSLYLSPSVNEAAAATKYKYVRTKTDSTSILPPVNTSGLYNFFGTNNGSFDEFAIPGATTNYVQPIVGTDFPDYACGLLLSEEWALLSDDDYIVWAKKGTILGKGGSLFADVTDYKSCCSTNAATGLPSCFMDAGGSCVANILTDASKIFKLSYGILDDNGCSDNVDPPCTNTPNSCCELSPNIPGKVYQFRNQVICANDGKWTYCDDESACETIGANQYACNADKWDNCTALGKTCSAGACVAACDNDNVQEGSEQCDGADLAGETCVSQGFPGGGVLSCTGTCTFDTSGCNPCSGAISDGVCPPGCSMTPGPNFDIDCSMWNCNPGAFPDATECQPPWTNAGTCISFDGTSCGGPNVWTCSGNCDDPTYDNSIVGCGFWTDSPQLACGCACGLPACPNCGNGACDCGETTATCAADCPPACVPTGPEDCAAAGDEDCVNGADCADPACPDGTICGGTNFCDSGSCVECTATNLTNCAAGEVCSAGMCIPCTGDGIAAASANLCCAGLSWIGGICTSACDPSVSFYCNPLRETVEDIVQGGQKLIGYVLGLIGSIALLFIVIAGMMYMTSAGNEERIASSKRILTGAIIGVAIALLAYGFLQVIISILNM